MPCWPASVPGGAPAFFMEVSRARAGCFRVMGVCALRSLVLGEARLAEGRVRCDSSLGTILPRRLLQRERTAQNFLEL